MDAIQPLIEDVLNSPLFYLLLFLTATSTFYQIKRPAIRGALGEWSVNRRLQKLGDGYSIFTDIYIPDGNGEYTQVDHIVISPFGISVIETKNYSGWIFGSERQRNWTQVIYKRKERFYNPVWQNYGHIQALKHFLQNESLPIQSIVAFTGDAELKLEQPIKSAEVIGVHQLTRLLKKRQAGVLHDEEIQTICSSLNELVLPKGKERQQIKRAHLKSVKKKQVFNRKGRTPATRSEEKPVLSAKLNNSDPVTEKCPRCSSTLIIRKGKFGEFLGCSGYPKCRYTKK